MSNRFQCVDDYFGKAHVLGGDKQQEKEIKPMEVEEKPSDPIPEPRSNKDRLLAMGFSPIVVSMAVDENPNTPFDDLIQIALALSTEGRAEELSAWDAAVGKSAWSYE